MLIFRRILFTGLLGGIIAGLVLTGIQAYKVLPLIVEAETYEVATEPAGNSHDDSAATAHADQAAAGDSYEAEWVPDDGAERVGFILLSNVLIGIGFSLLLAVGFTLRAGIDWYQGLLWGLGGFAAFNLAPALGLPPELPGMAAADLVARQIWWAGTAAATVAGLTLLVFSPRLVVKLVGIGIVIVPHAVGAPHPEVHEAGNVPAELAASFVSATLVANLLFWLIAGSVSGYTFKRLRSA